MADAKVSSLDSVTPIGTDLIYLVDDPGGTPLSKQSTIDDLLAVSHTHTEAQISDFGTYPTITSGSGAPPSTPGKVGDIHIDTANDNAYIAVGSASSADWQVSNDGLLPDGDKGDIVISSTGTVWTVDAGVITLAKIDPTILSGSDATLMTGTAGAANKIAKFNADGDIVEASETSLSAPAADRIPGYDFSAGAMAWFTIGSGLTITGTTITADAVDPDILKADTADVLTAGFATTPYDAGTQSSGTFTPDEANGNMQYAVNGGAHTLAPPTNNCTIIIQYTNNASAGTITTSGFTKVETSELTTTDTEEFFFYITKCNGLSSLRVEALQ